MTKWNEFPLRPQGQPWPGLNTRGGFLDPGSGQLEDGSINAIINEGDILAKRPGFVRGLEERFEDVVCGLFRYTDDCGVEYLLVADAESIKIRTPFTIPTIANSDAFPNDTFEGDLSEDNWRNTADYETFEGALRLKSSASAIAAQSVPLARHLTWFKEATSFSYQSRIQYEFSLTSAFDQVAAVSIKKDPTSAYLQAEVLYDGTTYKAFLSIIEATERKILGEADLGGVALGTGFVTLAYNRGVGDRLVTATFVPGGGATVTLTHQVTELQDASFGQQSAVGLSCNGAAPTGLRLLQVTGNAI